MIVPPSTGSKALFILWFAGSAIVFLARHRRKKTPIVVLDIPLLFESGGRASCDTVMVVSAPAFLQRRRALARSGMTLWKLTAILARQMPDYEKRRRADIVIATGLGRADTYRRIQRYLHRMQKAGGGSTHA